MFWRRTVKAGKARVIIDWQSPLGMPHLTFQGDPRDYGKAIKKTSAYLKKRGIERVTTAIDLAQAKPETVKAAVRRGALPIMVIVELSVDRLKHG